jgi:hypothetical protein
VDRGSRLILRNIQHGLHSLSTDGVDRLSPELSPLLTLIEGCIHA